MSTTRQWDFKIKCFERQCTVFPRLFKRSKHGSRYRGQNYIGPEWPEGKQKFLRVSGRFELLGVNWTTQRRKHKRKHKSAILLLALGLQPWHRRCRPWCLLGLEVITWGMGSKEIDCWSRCFLIQAISSSTGPHLAMKQTVQNKKGRDGGGVLGHRDTLARIDRFTWWTD